MILHVNDFYFVNLKSFLFKYEKSDNLPAVEKSDTFKGCNYNFIIIKIS